MSLVARLITLLLLPPTPSFLAPDEGTYAYLASWVGNSQDVERFPDYGAGLYNSSKTLVLPAAALIKIGFDELVSVRIVSITLGLTSIYFFTKILFLVLQIRSLQDLEGANSRRIVLMVLLIFAFLPSNFIWSTLGLRESASMATVLASIFFLLRLCKIEFSKGKFLQNVLTILFPILALALSFGARRQTAFVFVIFFCIPFLVMNNRRKHLQLTGVILLGTVLGLLYSTTPTIIIYKQFAWISDEQVDRLNLVSNEQVDRLNLDLKKTTAIAIEADGTAVRCKTEGDRITTNSDELVCVSVTVTKKRILFGEVLNQAPVQTLDELEEKRESNRLNAQTALAKTNCTKYSQVSINNVICNAKEFPYRITAFLIRPLPIVDSGSLSNNLASAENLLWMLLLISFVYSLITSFQKRLKLEVVIPTTLFILFFSALAALYEGNLGTAFRHKSTILWALLLVTAVGAEGIWRKPKEESQEENPRYSS